jgi:hypothetical protein
MTRVTELRESKASDNGDNDEQSDKKVLEMSTKGMVIVPNSQHHLYFLFSKKEKKCDPVISISNFYAITRKLQV